MPVCHGGWWTRYQTHEGASRVICDNLLDYSHRLDYTQFPCYTFFSPGQAVAVCAWSLCSKEYIAVAGVGGLPSALLGSTEHILDQGSRIAALQHING